MHVAEIAQRAADSAAGFAATEPRLRAKALVGAADAIDAHAAALIAVAEQETGLTGQRLEGEVRRTSNQLRLFAETIVDGSYLDARIDVADPDYVTGPRPDVRRVLEPVGPVLNFAASNFPFAFSVAGGDSAAALAAGCPLIVKAHPGHPELSRQTAAVVADALASCGMPDGVFQLAEGQQEGVELLRDERIRAGAFTGSLRAGRLLADIAAARAHPIPFFGELGSVNPVYVTAAAVAAEPDLLTGFIASVAGSAGQLCTKPGFLFVPADAELGDVAAAAAQAVAAVGEQRMLNPGIGRGYRARRDTVLAVPGVRVLAGGTMREATDGQWYTTATVVEVDAELLRENRDQLLDESFGPLSIVVRYGAVDALPGIHRDLFPGNLTATVHATAADAPRLQPLVTALAETSGRVLFGGWPTGVSVTGAMQHGGPYPATTTDATSVGTASITRFLRGVAYQNAPQALLPPALRDDNPWRVPQSRAPAGVSASWGSLSGTPSSAVRTPRPGVGSAQ